VTKAEAVVVNDPALAAAIQAGQRGKKAPRSSTAFVGKPAQVLLVSMPFGPLFQPSLGLSLLKGQLATTGTAVANVLYFTLRFAERIGTEFYVKIADGYPATFDMVGEWLFSHALFGKSKVEVDGYLKDVLLGASPAHRLPEAPDETFISTVLAAREQVEDFLDDCLKDVLEHAPAMVGFTSVFQQHVASLALAKRIKAARPSVFIVFGGANCEGAMGAETARQFHFVDAVVSGEGDMIFADLVRRVLHGQTLTDISGVYTRDSCQAVNGRYPNTPSVFDMNVLPYPDYDDYFLQFESSRLDKRNTPRLLYESARGCWWGEKMHCTFCGLNGASMKYRSKSAQRALDELIYLTGRYPGSPVSVVDNILDMDYFKDFIPELIERKLGIELFFEVKANLRKEQVRLLHEAGVTMIQPGTESFSSHVLKLMRKGVSGIQNVQLLKWCKELGVTPYWNVLWGFPGEPPEEYERMARLAPLLVHLRPPQSTSILRLDRFSPNFEQAESFGFVNVDAYPAYYYVYPLEQNAVFNLAYYFTFGYANGQDVGRYTKPLWDRILEWKAVHKTSDLFSIDKETSLLIWDLRPGADDPLTVLTGLDRQLYILCDRARSVRELQQAIQDHEGKPTDEEAVEERLQSLLQRGLVIREGNLFLSLIAAKITPFRPEDRS
jgi:ribosomal peptide maturation radical SAM protein 1